MDGSSPSLGRSGAQRPPARRALLVVAVVVSIAVAVTIWRRGGTRAPEPGLPAGVGLVHQVVDGDTIDVDIGGRRERVRLIGIDTPEVAHDGRAGECFGAEAATYTRRQLPEGTPVRLVRDVVGRDDYGRLLAYVYRYGDGSFLNEAIVAGGFAVPLTIAPNDAHAVRFVAAATAAEASGLGLWSACSG